jgi:four helix bundle protein
VVSGQIAPRVAIESYEDLEVWKLAMDLAELSYALTSRFPRDELYGLTAQIRRASVSIPSNIAEGFGRDGTASYIHFLKISLGSARELETQLLLASRLQLAEPRDVLATRDTAVRVSKMLRALIRKLEPRMIK